MHECHVHLPQRPMRITDYFPERDRGEVQENYRRDDKKRKKQAKKRKAAK